MSEKRNTGAPGITRLPSGRWQVRYREEGGRQKKRSFTTLGNAKRFQREVLRAIDRDEYVDPRQRQQPLSALIERYLRDATHLAPSTRMGYEAVVRCYISPHLGSHPVGSIKTPTVRDWLRTLSMAHSPATVAKCKRVLSVVLSQAVTDGTLMRNPTQSLSVPTPRPRTTYLDVNEVDALVHAMPEPFGLPVLLAAWSGVRAGELWALRARDYNPATATLTVSRSLSEAGGVHVFKGTKTGRTRAIPVPDLLAKPLAAHLAGAPQTSDTLMFKGQMGGPVRHSNFMARVFRPTVKATLTRKDEVHFHDLRHTAATLWIAAGAHPKVVQTRLGHSSISVTFDVYGHLLPEQDGPLNARLDEMWDARTRR